MLALDWYGQATIGQATIPDRDSGIGCAPSRTKGSPEKTQALWLSRRGASALYRLAQAAGGDSHSRGTTRHSKRWGRD